MLFIAPDIVTLTTWVVLPVRKENACCKRSMERSEMTGIRARCRFLCSDCRAYKKNIHSNSDMERLSFVFEKLYGYAVAPEAVYCDGCLEPDENNPCRPGTERCRIRDCVLEKKDCTLRRVRHVSLRTDGEALCLRGVGFTKGTRDPDQ